MSAVPPSRCFGGAPAALAVTGPIGLGPPQAAALARLLPLLGLR